MRAQIHSCRPRDRWGRAAHSLVVALAVSAGCSSPPPPNVVGTHATEPGHAEGDAGSAPSRTAGGAPADPPEAPPATLADIGLDERAMDARADPCQDFYQYACGGWMARTDVAAGERAETRLSELSRRVVDDLHELLEQARRGAHTVQPDALLGRFYGACMDRAPGAEGALGAVQTLLDRAEALAKERDHASVLGTLHRQAIFAGFAIRVEPDDSAARTYRLIIDNSALGLPTRRHYLDPQRDAEQLRRRYREHIERVFTLAGDSGKAARKAASRVLHVETELARVVTTSADQRRPAGWHQPVDRRTLAALTGSFDWNSYLHTLGRADIAHLSITSREYLIGLSRLMRKSGARSFSDYLRWRILDVMTPALPPEFARARAEFARLLAGREPARTEPADTGANERWRTCVQATDQALGWPLSRAYAERRLSAERRRAARTALTAMVQAQSARLAGLGWLSEDGKRRARVKLDALAIELGQPENLDLGDLAGRIGPDAGYAAMWLAANTWAVDRALARVGKRAADVRADWHTYPHRVDGYYDPRANALVASAGLLQPPFFAETHSPSVNLGALAMILGHELVHSIDDLGARYDATGALGPWWTDAEQRAYRERAQCLATANHGPTPAADTPRMRTQSLREDIADLGGVLVAWHAHKARSEGSLGASAPAPAPTVAGFDGNQQFFVAAAQAACEKLASGQPVAHRFGQRSRAAARVNQVMRQVPGFAESFQCAADTPMSPTTRCDIW